MTFLPAEIIKKKRNNLPLTREEIYALIEEYATGRLPDYQMSAWLMAVFFNGMNDDETHHLTQAMLHSGEVVKFDSPDFHVDKHSTGGVGDKTSLILAPIVAAAGIAVPMISGRGLGHTGGTLDKLESIPGFNTQLDLSMFRKMVRDQKLSFIGQTKEICPADKKIYALRDVTATVESLPLICASIMSKKIAEGIDGLVLDVKVGSGAFMKTEADARKLAEKLSAIGRAAGKRVSALITSMVQPLGQMVGNALEIEECLSIMRNEKAAHTVYADTRELSLELAAEMIRLSGQARDAQSAMKIAVDTLESGKAYEKFAEVCHIQGGDLLKLPKATHHYEVKASSAGYVSQVDTEKVGIASILLGAGRAKTSDIIDPVAGIQCLKKIGERVEMGEPLYILSASQNSQFAEAESLLTLATNISLQKQTSPSLILTRLLETI